MRQRKIGSLSVSVIGLGTNNFGFTMAEDAVLPVVDAALEAGINFFDTADSYLTSEERCKSALGNGQFTSGNYGSAKPVAVVSTSGSGTLSGVKLH